MQNKTLRTVSWVNPDSSRESLKLIVVPIPAYPNIRQYTREFAKNIYSWNDLWIDPKMIVIHAMDFGTVKEALEKSSFLHHRMPKEWGSMSKAGLLPNGAHFMVDRDGAVYCLMPPLKNEWMNERWDQANHRWMIRRHLEGNPMALGIENITPTNGQYDDVTRKQIQSNAKLIRWLLWFEHGKIQYVTSHHQFNDSTVQQSMLKQFQLSYTNPHYAVTDRTDVGDAILHQILELIGMKKWAVKSDFR